jgi:hypothetical protein
VQPQKERTPRLSLWKQALRINYLKTRKAALTPIP